MLKLVLCGWPCKIRDLSHGGMFVYVDSIEDTPQCGIMSAYDDAYLVDGNAVGQYDAMVIPLRMEWCAE